MKRLIAIAAVTLGSGLALANQPGSSTEQLKLPPDAKLIGVEQVDEIRAFPELENGKTTGGANVNTANKGNMPPAAKVEGVSAIDSVYTTNRPFKDTVSFLDKEFESPDLQPMVKTVTPSAVGYAVTLPTGKVAHVLVRNTKPTTIETIEAVTTAAEVPMKGDMHNQQMKNKSMNNPPGNSPGNPNSPNPSVPQ